MSTFNTGLTGDLSLSRLGKPGGFAPLGLDNKIPSINLPTSLAGGLALQGGYDASTNTPDLTVGAQQSDGSLYIVIVEGTQDIGNGAELFTVGDAVFYSTGDAKWYRLHGSVLSIEVVYDNSGTSIVGVNIQDAITELDTRVDVLEAGPTKTIATANLTFFVDADNGNDSNDGLTAGTAWQTNAHLTQELLNTDFNFFNLTVNYVPNVVNSYDQLLITSESTLTRCSIFRIACTSINGIVDFSTISLNSFAFIINNLSNTIVEFFGISVQSNEGTISLFNLRSFQYNTFFGSMSLTGDFAARFLQSLTIENVTFINAEISLENIEAAVGLQDIGLDASKVNITNSSFGFISSLNLINSFDDHVFTFNDCRTFNLAGFINLNNQANVALFDIQSCQTFTFNYQYVNVLNAAYTGTQSSGINIENSFYIAFESTVATTNNLSGLTSLAVDNVSIVRAADPTFAFLPYSDAPTFQTGSILNNIDADEVAYNNATSGLTATTVQTAIDKIDSTQDGILDGTTVFSLPAYDDDAAAGVGGLTTGQLFQTTGSGAAPLNVAGIVMIKT